VSAPVDQPVYVFEEFRLDSQRRILLGADGKPIALTPRLFDTLLYFVERAGQLLTKAQIMEAIWPRVVVEEHNLNKTVSELRRLLGEKPGEHKFIVTKPGHGYRFVADVSIELRAPDARLADREGATETIDHRAKRPKRTVAVVASKASLIATGSAATALALVGILAYVRDGTPPAERIQEPAAPVAQNSVAVLPFVDNSAAGDQTWLADGLSEQVLNSLARLPELKVTARTSSFQFRDEARDIREIAEGLGVANLLEGSVQSAGGQLRVTAQLIRAADGFQLWSNDYDGTVSDLFAFQRDVAERVAVALDVVLDEPRRAAMFASGTQDVEAFREYQEGWRIYRVAHLGETQQTLWDANRYFERAMELDPRFALAAVGRTDAFMHFLVEPIAPLAANSPYSREEALERLRQSFDFISENSSTATMRLVSRIQRESFSPTWERMQSLLAELRRQWDVNDLSFDSGVDSVLWLVHILRITGQHDLMRALAERHVATDPLSIDAWIRNVVVEIHARDFDAARLVMAQARRNLGESALMNEEFRIALLEGDGAKAIDLLELVVNQQASMVSAAIKGDRATAMPIADELEQGFAEIPPGAHLGGLLYTYYELGETERASVLVKRIDESPVGPQIFMLLLGVNGGAPYFDFADAPNFVAKLKLVHVDAQSLVPMPRLSTSR
jgi:TolB-like protein/DNA-binding winged helix-turn-helix (wHTH) protein